jgi:Family of unknown function (DUF6521)
VLRWEQRPVEVANLFNPAFCAALLQSSIKGFQSQRDKGMPYPLLFLVLPIVLHSYTRQTLPKTTVTKMHVWLQEHPEVRIGFVERSRNLVPYTKEALIFGIQTGTIKIGIDSSFIWVRRSLRTPAVEAELVHLLERAKFFGKWLTQFEEPSNVFTMWGIHP